MRSSNHPAIRALLRNAADGMTIKEMSARIGVCADSVRNALKAMPDVYVDRWVPAPRGTFEAVWCAVTPPENCPHPLEGKRAA